MTIWMKQSVVEADTEVESTIVPAWITEPENFAHYIDATLSMPGSPAEALCGAVFVPRQIAANLPVCPGCKSVYEDNQAMAMDYYRKGKG